MKHNPADLFQMQSLPLEQKVQMTKNRIRAWYDHYDGEVYLSFSGGKDSTVLKHIIDQMYDDIPSVFVNTGLEWPAVRQFAMKQKNVIRVDPEMKFYDVIEHYGYPVISKENAKKIYEVRNTKSEYWRSELLGDKRRSIPKKWRFMIDAPFKISPKCCDVMKKNPVKRYEKETGRKGIVGIMTEESLLRFQSWIDHGCNAFDMPRPLSRPMSFWKEQDVLQYIYENKLEIASVYGDVVKDENGYHTTGLYRTGCMFCMFGVQLEREPNRFQIMKKIAPRQWEYCMNTLGLKGVMDYMGLKYE